MGVVIPLQDKNKHTASIKPLIDLTKTDMGRVNQEILARAGSDVEMIPEVANHLISSGGKRLRPMLTLAGATMFGYRDDEMQGRLLDELVPEVAAVDPTGVRAGSAVGEHLVQLTHPVLELAALEKGHVRRCADLFHGPRPGS